MLRSAILALPEDQAYVEALNWFAAGKQADVETLLQALASKYPQDQPIAFAGAVIVRSRFDVQAAAPLLERVAGMNAQSVIGQSAALMLKIDAHQDLAASFSKLITLTRSPGVDPMILWLGGIASRTLNQNAQGADCYRALLKQWDPGPSLVHQTFANLLDGLKQYDEALVQRKLAVQLEPAGWSYEGMALTLWNLKRYEEADQAFATSVRYSPNVGNYYGAWADMLLEEMHWDDSIAKCKLAIKLNPNDAKACNTWGKCLMEQNDYDGAFDKFSLCLKMDPNFYWALGNMSWIMERKGQTDRAIDYRKSASQIAPSGDTFDNLGNLYVRLGRYAPADDAFAQAVKLAPKSPAILTDWGDSLRLWRRPGDGAEKCRQATAIDPAYGRGWYVLGMCLQATAKAPDELNAVEQDYRAAIKTSPDLWQAYIRLADMLTAPQDSDEASALRKKGAELHDKAGG